MVDDKMPEFAERKLKDAGMSDMGQRFLRVEFGGNHGCYGLTDTANEARLTAAAPLLLVACEAALAHLKTMYEYDDAVVRLLHHAIDVALFAEPEA